MRQVEGRWLTMPLKAWGHWWLQEIAWCSWLQWLVRNGLLGACQAAIKWRMAVVYASYSLRTKEAIKESAVHESLNLQLNVLRKADQWRCRMNSIRSSADRHTYASLQCSPLVWGALRFVPIICTKAHKAVELLKRVLLSLLFEDLIHDLKQQGYDLTSTL